MTWCGMYGFNNTYGLAVRKEIADQYHLKTYSDLAKVSGTLTFGAEYDFYEREDGYDALCDAYAFHFKKTSDMDIGLKYKAINQGKVDVMTIFTTDGQLSVSDIVVLEDDKQFYPSYLCGNVVRLDTLEKHPELRAVLELSLIHISRLEKEGIFLVPLAKGLRVSIASISEEKCRMIPAKIKAVMEE